MVIHGLTQNHYCYQQHLLYFLELSSPLLPPLPHLPPLSSDVLDLSVMMEDTKYLLLLAKVHQKANRQVQALHTLNNARDMQSRYIKISDSLLI